MWTNDDRLALASHGLASDILKQRLRSSAPAVSRSLETRVQLVNHVYFYSRDIGRIWGLAEALE